MQVRHTACLYCTWWPRTPNGAKNVCGLREVGAKNNSNHRILLNFGPSGDTQENERPRLGENIREGFEGLPAR